MTNIVTYHSLNAKSSEQWLAYVVLPDGNQWLVRFTGETEEIAKAKAVRLYESECSKRPTDLDEDFVDGRGQHFKGKAWLIHKITREKIRVPLEQVDEYLGEYERGGPRSK
jgi:hypothetical protein